MSKFTFGDLTAKANEINAVKEKLAQSEKVKHALKFVAFIDPLPLLEAGIHDYPPHLHRYGITALREARNRIEQQRREADPA